MAETITVRKSPSIMSTIRNNWTMSLLRTYRPYMTVPAVLKFRKMILKNERQTGSPKRLVRLSMRTTIPGKLWMRESGSDISTFHEVVIRQVYRAAAVHARDARFIMDLGANIGLASRYFLTAAPRSKVFAVEPQVETFAVLARNMQEEIRRGRCEVLHGAAWNTNGRICLEAPPHGADFDSVRVANNSFNIDCLTIPSFTMSSLLQRCGFPHIDLLKVDIEGAEIQLFQNDTSWVDRVRSIAIEFHGNSRIESRFDELMQRFGFQVDDSHAHTVYAFRAASAE